MSPEEDLIDRLAFAIWIDHRLMSPEEKAAYKVAIWDKLRDRQFRSGTMEFAIEAARVAIKFLAAEGVAKPADQADAMNAGSRNPSTDSPSAAPICACRARRKGSLKVVP